MLFKTIYENPPTTAAYIFDLAPPEIGMPPKTIATMMFIPISPAVVVVTDGVYTRVINAPIPTPIPAIKKPKIA